MGRPQSRSGRGGEEKNSQPPPEIEPYNPHRPAGSPALYRLDYHGSLILFGADVKSACSYTSTPQYVFMAWGLIK
jgi:hypothetical protein